MHGFAKFKFINAILFVLNVHSTEQENVLKINM